MSIPYDRFLVKYLCSIPDDLTRDIKNGFYRSNGTYYLLPIEKTFHYNALCTGNFEKYSKYVTYETGNEHNETKFRKLYEDFDINKIEKITVRLLIHSQSHFWVMDGIHRIAILKMKNLYPKGIPIDFLNVIVFSEIQDIFRDALRKTVNKSHYNSWNNRLEFGYHSFDIFDVHIQGQRNPLKRFAKIKPYYNFTGKNVLDLGCNTGGMLFHIPEIEKGIGLDFDTTCIESCNIFKSWLHFSANYDFYVQDLNTFNCMSFCNEKNFKPDIIFLLSLGSWIKNWKQLYTDCLNTCKTILFETNNDVEGIPQLELFKELGTKITLISDNSDDDCTNNHGRKTYLIEDIRT
jgi:hypothetical protein